MERSIILYFGTAVLALLGSIPTAALSEDVPTKVLIAQAGGGVRPGAGNGAQWTPAVQAKSGTAKAAAGGGGGNASLRRRVEQLEEQLIDLQVVIGTLESLARSGVSRTPQGQGGQGGLGASDAARLDGMETQIRALTAQIEQLNRGDSGQRPPERRSEAPGNLPPAGGNAPPPDASAFPPPVDVSRFGSTTVTSSSSEPGSSGTSPTASAPAVAPRGVEMAELAPVGNPKQLYEAAYGYLLQQDYGNAQAGFSDFLKRYPQDSLAPNALYWLGETHYVQRKYVDAAEAFDLVTASFASSSKAPDAQLKRAMSLAQLGKKKEACGALSVLASKFPGAAPHVKSKAASERSRIACR
jgi:tol-pal system protein YbgF